MNASDIPQLMLVCHVTMTTWQMQYVQITFLLHTFILYKTYSLCGCEVITIYFGLSFCVYSRSRSQSLAH